MTGSPKVQLICRYFSSLEAGRLDKTRDIFAADMVQIEYPNQLKPGGDRRDLAALVKDSHRGATMLAKQSYKICSVVEQGDLLAVEVFWEGELAIALGALPAGHKMTTYSAMFFKFQDGKIARQVNYDCFPNFPARTYGE